MLLLSISLSGCLCRNTERRDFGKLSKEALKTVPYSEGQVLQMKHSSGQQINFTVNTRITETITENPFTESCYEETYEKNTTYLEPDYPIFNISFILSNQGGYPYFSTSLSNSYFSTQLDSNQTFSLIGDNAEYIDSLSINDTIYKDVYKFNYYTWIDDTNSIYAEDIYYNINTGILKIDMNNDEFYILCVQK